MSNAGAMEQTGCRASAVAGFGQTGPLARSRILEAAGMSGVLDRGNGRHWFTWKARKRGLGGKAVGQR